MEDFLTYRLWNNPVESYLYFFGTILAAIIALKLVVAVITAPLHKLAAKTQTDFDDYLLTRLHRDATPAVFVAVIYFSLNHLELGARAKGFIDGTLLTFATFFGVRLLAAFVTFLLEKRWLTDSKGDFQAKNVRGLIGIIRVGIWALGVVFLLDNLGFEISAIIAGLGIGGIAVALAAQAVLGDLFSYVAIFFDKPFEVGDFIIVDQYMGEVEYIGLKTTRLRSLSGEQIVVSNSKLTGSWLRNYKRMERRRVMFTLQVTYDTSEAFLAEIPAIIKAAINADERTAFDRAHFARYGEYALVFEAVYYVLHSDYNVYMDIHQAVNLTIKAEFERRGIRFALPTQTLLFPGTAPAADS